MRKPRELLLTSADRYSWGGSTLHIQEGGDLGTLGKTISKLFSLDGGQGGEVWKRRRTDQDIFSNRGLFMQHRRESKMVGKKRGNVPGEEKEGGQRKMVFRASRGRLPLGGCWGGEQGKGH